MISNHTTTHDNAPTTRASDNDNAIDNVKAFDNDNAYDSSMKNYTSTHPHRMSSSSASPSTMNPPHSVLQKSLILLSRFHHIRNNRIQLPSAMGSIGNSAWHNIKEDGISDTDNKIINNSNDNGNDNGTARLRYHCVVSIEHRLLSYFDYSRTAFHPQLRNAILRFSAHIERQIYVTSVSKLDYVNISNHLLFEDEATFLHFVYVNALNVCHKIGFHRCPRFVESITMFLQELNSTSSNNESRVMTSNDGNRRSRTVAFGFVSRNQHFVRGSTEALVEVRNHLKVASAKKLNADMA